MMKLIIVRHGETTHNRDGITQGQLDTQLTKLGKKQAEKLAKRLINEEIDIIYSSDLKRCKDTLGPFLKLKKIPVHYTKDLREVSFGVFQERPFSEFAEWIDSRKEHRFDKRPEEGESFNDVRKRVKRFLDVMLKKEKGKGVLVMTHGMTKRALLMKLFKRDDEKYYDELKELSKNTALTILNLRDDNNHKVEYLYSIEHLEDLG